MSRTEPFAGYAKLSDCDKLAIVEEALIGLAAGKAKQEVRYGDNWIEFLPGSVAFLERERQRLRILCGAQQRSAISIGRSC